MKISVYQMNVEEVQRLCLSGLADSGFRIENHDAGKGHIHAVKEGEFPLYFSLMDLKIFRSKYAVTVAVISSNMSKLFGSFYHNRFDEETFIEKFLARLK